MSLVHELNFRFSHLSVYQMHPKDLLKHRLLDPIPRAFDSVSLGIRPANLHV